MYFKESSICIFCEDFRSHFCFVVSFSDILIIKLNSVNFDLGLVEMDWRPAVVARKSLNSRELQFIFYTCIWEACIWIPWNSQGSKIDSLLNFYLKLSFRTLPNIPVELDCTEKIVFEPFFVTRSIPWFYVLYIIHFSYETCNKEVSQCFPGRIIALG